MNDPFEQYLAIYIVAQRNKPVGLTTRQYIELVASKNDDIPEFWRQRYNKRSAEVIDLKSQVLALRTALDGRTAANGRKRQCTTMLSSPSRLPNNQPRQSKLQTALEYLNTNANCDLELQRCALSTLSATLQDVSTDKTAKQVSNQLWSLFTDEPCIRNEIVKELVALYMHCSFNHVSTEHVVSALAAASTFSLTMRYHTSIHICQVISAKTLAIPGHPDPPAYKLDLFSSFHGLIRVLIHADETATLTTFKHHLKFKLAATRATLTQLRLPHRVKTALIRDWVLTA